jgi:molybdate transport system permease protein
VTLDVGQAVWLSLVVGLSAAILGSVPAVGVAWLLARRRFVGKWLLTALVMTPLVLPPVVTGLLLLRLFGRTAPLGALLAGLGMPVTFTLLGAVLAALVVAFPVYVLTIRGAFEAIDPRYEEVSLTLGQDRRGTFRRITLPLAAPGIAAGFVLAFARGLGEFGATAIVAGNMEGETRTISLAIYALLDGPGNDPRVLWLALASIGLSLLALAGYEALTRWQRRRLDVDV